MQLTMFLAFTGSRAGGNVATRAVSLLRESQIRRVSVQRTPRTMRAWLVHKYGGPEQLDETSSAQLPIIKHPKDLLLKVHACSLNPIDARLREGYGNSLLNAMRQVSGDYSGGTEFPFATGRDFSGTVVAVGSKVGQFRPGDEVWGALSVAKQGTHAEYVVASQQEISRKPQSISHVEAASIPYVAATAWSSLHVACGYSERNLPGSRAVVTAASGGLGTFVTQLLSAWGAEVTATCSGSAACLVSQLGASSIIDYKQTDVRRDLNELASDGYDLIFDSIGNMTDTALEVLKTWKGSSYITVRSPVMTDFTDATPVCAFPLSAAKYCFDAVRFARGGRRYIWGFFFPNSKALQHVAKMVDSEKIRPVIDSVYDFDDMPKAIEKLEEGHARGKIILNICDQQYSST